MSILYFDIKETYIIFTIESVIAYNITFIHKLKIQSCRGSSRYQTKIKIPQGCTKYLDRQTKIRCYKYGTWNHSKKLRRFLFWLFSIFWLFRFNSYYKQIFWFKIAKCIVRRADQQRIFRFFYLFSRHLVQVQNDSLVI